MGDTVGTSKDNALIVGLRATPRTQTRNLSKVSRGSRCSIRKNTFILRWAIKLFDINWSIEIENINTDNPYY